MKMPRIIFRRAGAPPDRPLATPLLNLAVITSGYKFIKIQQSILCVISQILNVILFKMKLNKLLNSISLFWASRQISKSIVLKIS